MSKRYTKYLILSILFFSALNIVYQIAVVENPNFNIYDLGVNLLSEFAGMIFTVLIFNEFLSYRQQLTDTGKLRALYIELDALIASVDFPFRAAAESCLEDFHGDVWDRAIIDVIRERIVLSERADCVFPSLPWYLLFSMQGDKILRKCENIRIQYQGLLEPQIADYLFYLVNHSEVLADLLDIRTIYENDLLLHYERPQNLGSYFAPPTDRDLQVIRDMRGWVGSQKAQREKQAAGVQKYHRKIMVFMTVFFLIGAVGFTLHGSYVSAAFFAGAALVLCAAFARSRRAKRRHN